MKELGDDHALELFSRHAFKQNNPHIGFEELSSRVIKYAQGVPLAIEILCRKTILGKCKKQIEKNSQYGNPEGAKNKF